jgi:cytochrome c oxidase cbb3-type subunit 3
MKKHHFQYCLTFLFVFATGLAAFAQQSAEVADGPKEDIYFFDRFFTMGLVIIAAVVILASLLIMYRLLSAMIKMQEFQLFKEHGMEEYLQEIQKPRPSAFGQLWQKWERSVPIEREKDVLFDHDFDGIRELDNVLPPWWLALFYITIIWGLGYLVYYHFGGPGKSSHEEYKMEVQAAQETLIASAEKTIAKGGGIDENTVTLLTDAAALESGKGTFISLCAACHGQKGEGGIGPNLTDDNWIHGCTVKDVFRVITVGVAEKGMVSWKSQLTPLQIQQVSSYLLTLRGTNPPNPKAPQGEVCKADATSAPQAAPADTTKMAKDNTAQPGK